MKKKWPACEEYCLFWVNNSCWNNENYPDPVKKGKSSICMFAIDKTDDLEVNRILKMYPELAKLIDRARVV